MLKNKMRLKRMAQADSRKKGNTVRETRQQVQTPIEQKNPKTPSVELSKTVLCAGTGKLRARFTL